MFRNKNQNKPLYFKDNNLVKNLGYSFLMQFIKDNKAIPNKLAEIENSNADQEKIERLHIAIQKGDLNDSIFFDKDIESYVLALYKNNALSPIDFLTTEMYILALMQFTDKLALKETDQHLKQITEVEIFSIDNEEIKNLLLNQFMRHYKDFYPNKIEKDEVIAKKIEELTEQLNKLSPLNKQVIRIKKPADFDDGPYGNVRSNPTFGVLSEFPTRNPLTTKDEDYYYIPSAGIMNEMLNIINPERPIHFAPIYGNIGLHSLYLIHQLGFHPCNLYSTYVKTNPSTVHEVALGPFVTLLHDMVAHTYWGNLINKNHYRFLFEYLMPIIADIKKLKLDYITEEKELGFFSLNDLNFMNERINEDLTEANITDQDVFNININKLLGIAYSQTNFGKITDIEFFQVLIHFYKDKDFITKNFDIDIQKLLCSSYFNLDPEVFNFLEKTDLKKDPQEIFDLYTQSQPRPT